MEKVATHDAGDRSRVKRQRFARRRRRRRNRLPIGRSLASFATVGEPPSAWRPAAEDANNATSARLLAPATVSVRSTCVTCAILDALEKHIFGKDLVKF